MRFELFSWYEIISNAIGLFVVCMVVAGAATLFRKKKKK